jgi:uncharacterized protein yddF
MSRLVVWLGATPGWSGDHSCAVIDVFWDFQKTLYRETHAHLEGGEMALYNHPVAVLNSGIVTADGRYVLETIGLEEARRLVRGRIESFVGHQPTNDLMSTLLGVEIPYNRGIFSHKVGQIALIFKLNERIPNGVQLSKAEIEAIGYSFKKLIRYD